MRPMPGRDPQKTISFISKQLGVPRSQVVPGAHLHTDLGADSLDHVELVMGLEVQHHMEIPDEVSGKWCTVGDVMRDLHGHSHGLKKHAAIDFAAFSNELVKIAGGNRLKTLKLLRAIFKAK